jgi:hypothetical protein
MEFVEYGLVSPTLCMGERVKGGIFRPCDTKTIRYSLVTGALRAYSGSVDLHAAGFLVDEHGYNVVEHFTYSPRDRAAGTSKVPITAQYLAKVKGLIYVKNGCCPLPDEFCVTMGALKSRGFGRCHLSHRRTVQAGDPVLGQLRTRIPIDIIQEFDIRRVLKPIYGYLFRPLSATSGTYVLSVFEGSEVVGPACLLKEVRSE